MSENQDWMFEVSFQRPSNFFKLDPQTQWSIDKSLGILDWEAKNLTQDQLERLKAHYDKD